MNAFWKITCMASAIVCFGAPAAFAASTLQSLEGDWEGRGLLRDRPATALERGLCRLSVRQVPDNMHVALTGRCAGGSGSASVTASIEKVGTNGELWAVFSSPIFQQDAEYSGQETGNRMTFSTRTPLNIDGRLYHSQLVFSFSSAGEFELIETMTAVSGYEDVLFLRLTFERTSGQ